MYEAVKAWRKKNPEKVARNRSNWQLANPGKSVEYKRIWNANNVERAAASKKAWSKKNAEKKKVSSIKWAKDNANKVARSNKRWARANPAKVYAKAARHRAAKLQATPGWANKNYIEDCYANAAVRKKRDGTEWHVDHIVPLKSPLVCGLHCEDNLQVIPGKDNAKKSNKYWPDMWELQV